MDYDFGWSYQEPNYDKQPYARKVDRSNEIPPLGGNNAIPGLQEILETELRMSLLRENGASILSLAQRLAKKIR